MEVRMVVVRFLVMMENSVLHIILILPSNFLQGPYIDGKYLTSADVALAPKLYIIQIALAHYKNWSNIEPFYPALSRYMKVGYLHS